MIEIAIIINQKVAGCILCHQNQKRAWDCFPVFTIKLKFYFDTTSGFKETIESVTSDRQLCIHQKHKNLNIIQMKHYFFSKQKKHT